MRRLLYITSLATLLMSCGDFPISLFGPRIDVNLGEFEAITEAYPYNELSPAEAVDYLEVLLTYGPNTEEVHLSKGTKCANATDSLGCVTAFDAFQNQVGGFGVHCLPGYCAHYVKYQSADNISAVYTQEQLSEFLGTIDTKSDAILTAIAHNYRFNSQRKETGAIRTRSDGFELLVTKLVSACVPVQTNRYLIHVASDGTINILQEEVYEKDKDSCI